MELQLFRRIGHTGIFCRKSTALVALFVMRWFSTASLQPELRARRRFQSSWTKKP